MHPKYCKNLMIEWRIFSDVIGRFKTLDLIRPVTKSATIRMQTQRMSGMLGIISIFVVSKLTTMIAIFIVTFERNIGHRFKEPPQKNHFPPLQFILEFYLKDAAR